MSYRIQIVLNAGEDARSKNESSSSSDGNSPEQIDHHLIAAVLIQKHKRRI